MKHYLQEQVELIEKEFPEVEYEDLFNTVWNLIAKKEDYDKMCEVDKFDYLVDTILENGIDILGE